MNQTNAEWINSKISLGFYFIDNFSLQSIRINSLYFIWNLNKSKLCLHNVKKFTKSVHVHCTCIQAYVTFRCTKHWFNLDRLFVNCIIFFLNLNKKREGGGHTVGKSILLFLYPRGKNYYNKPVFRGGHYGEGAAIQYTTLEPFANFSTLKNIFFLFCHNNGIISLITKHCSLQCFNYLFYSIVQ